MSGVGGLRAYSICPDCAGVFVTGAQCPTCSGLPDPIEQEMAQAAAASPPRRRRRRIAGGSTLVGLGIGLCAAVLIVALGS